MSLDQDFEWIDMFEYYQELGWSGDYSSLNKYQTNYIGFFMHSAINNKIPKIYVELFMQQENLAIVLTPTHSELNRPFPENCCNQALSNTCAIAGMRNRILDIMQDQKAQDGYIQISTIYNQLYYSGVPCCLNDIPMLNYLLYLLVKNETLEYRKSEFGENEYRMSRKPKKKGPGRPRKTIHYTTM